MILWGPGLSCRSKALPWENGPLYYIAMNKTHSFSKLKQMSHTNFLHSIFTRCYCLCFWKTKKTLFKPFFSSEIDIVGEGCCQPFLNERILSWQRCSFSHFLDTNIIVASNAFYYFTRFAITIIVIAANINRNMNARFMLIMED